MKMTVITESGKLIGAMEGHITQPDGSESPKPTKDGQFRAGLMAGPGQKLDHIEVPDALRKIDDPEEFHRQLSAHIK